MARIGVCRWGWITWVWMRRGTRKSQSLPSFLHLHTRPGYSVLTRKIESHSLMSKTLIQSNSLIQTNKRSLKKASLRKERKHTALKTHHSEWWAITYNELILLWFFQKLCQQIFFFVISVYKSSKQRQSCMILIACLFLW